MRHKGEGNQSIILLEQAICDYLFWMIDKGYTHRTWALHERLVNHFSDFIHRRVIVWENIFTFETLEAFQEECKLTYASMAVRGLARYLHAQQRIPRPLIRQPRELPCIYE